MPLEPKFYDRKRSKCFNATPDPKKTKPAPGEKPKADTEHDKELDDISPDRYIGEQIEEERKNSEEENLLEEKR